MKVYFLGAGATKAVAGKAPLNDNLLDFAFADDQFDDIADEKKLLKEFTNDIFYAGTAEKLPRIEDLLSFIDYNLHRKTFYLKNYSFDNLVEVRNALVRIIAVVLKNSLTNLDSNIIGDFVQKLAKEEVIISTNYDIVVDNELFNELRNINYGPRLRRNVCPVERADGTVRAGSTPLFKNMNKGSIPLLKIHGSLNWLYCPKCDEIDITVGQKGAADYLGKGYDLMCSNNNCTAGYEPLLVTPTKFKIYENRFLRQIWELSRDCLSRAEEIVFIGYSFPEADTEIRCLLLNALNQSSNRAKITFVDRPGGSNDIDNYLRLLGDVEHNKNGFVDYVNNM